MTKEGTEVYNGIDHKRKQRRWFTEGDTKSVSSSVENINARSIVQVTASHTCLNAVGNFRYQIVRSG